MLSFNTVRQGREGRYYGMLGLVNNEDLCKYVSEGRGSLDKITVGYTYQWHYIKKSNIFVHYYIDDPPTVTAQSATSTSLVIGRSIDRKRGTRFVPPLNF